VTACAKVLEIGPEDNFLALLPLNHAFALTTLLLLPVPTGAKVTTLASLGPQDLLAALKKENITIMTVVPAIARLLAQMLKRKNLEGLGAKRGAALFGEKFRLLVCGGAVLSPTIEREINEAGVPVVQGYGLSENSPVVAVNPPHANRIGSVGVPLKGVTVRLGPTNERGEGELRIGGESVMQGYFNRPEATADVLKNGELHTGDIASIDADGYIHICGRSKNVIITENGKNVYPEEIESELAKCPLIKECAVVGLKREDKGAISEEIVAAVTLQSEAIAVHLQMTPEQIHLENKALQEAMSEVVRSFCLNLADYKRVERTVLLAEMPRTSSGKVRVSELKELLKRI